MAVIDLIQIRSGTAAAWTSANPVLALAEMGLETDTGKVKFGDGSTAWNSLSYKLAPIASPTFTGTPAAPTAAVDTNTTQLATTAMVLAQAASATPSIDGTAEVGTSTRFARGDHVHPTDTSRAPLASPTFTGSITTPIEKNTAAQTTVAGATSGSAVFSQPNQGSSYKNVVAYCNALLGAAVYTFPTAFTNAPTLVGALAGIGVATTTQITLTGTTSSGFVIAEGY